MFVTKIKGVLAVALVVGLALGGVGAGIGLFPNPVAMAQQAKAQPATGQANQEEKPPAFEQEKNGSLDEQVKAQVDEVRAKVVEMNQALWKGEYDKAVDLMPPYLIEKQGGREKMLATSKQVMEKMKARFKLRSYKIGDPVFVVRGSHRYVIFPTTTELGWADVVDGIVSDPVTGTVQTGQAFAVGISLDRGKTWKFVNGDQHQFRDHVEDFFGRSVQLPAVSTVEAEGPKGETNSKK